MTARPFIEGRSSLRVWSVHRTESAVVVDIWSDARQKTATFVVWAIALVPAYLLWTLVGTNSTSTLHWMSALGYTVAVFIATLVAIDLLGREAVRLDLGGITVRRFGTFAWITEFLETERGADVATGREAALFRGIAVYTGSRRVDFGRLLPGDLSEEIAAVLRESIERRAEDELPMDGVARRVVRHRSQNTPAGADDLMPVADQRPMVFDGVLHWGPRPLSWAAMFWVGWMICLFADALDNVEERLLPAIVGTLLLGAFICRGGVLSRLLLRRRSGLSAQHPNEPWHAVPYWEDGVIAMPVWRRCGVSGSALVLGVAAIVASFPGLFGPGSGNVYTMSMAGLWCAAWAYRFQNVIFQGETEVRVRSMPVPARGDVVLDFAIGPRAAHYETITFTLVRVVEVPRAVEAPFVGYSHRAVYELPEDQPPPAPGEQVELRFSLPPDASGTDLTRGRPTYWLLEVEGQTSSGFYSEIFPVPIYDV